jgi:hypothetical protein
MKHVLYVVVALGSFLGSGQEAKADLLAYSLSGTGSGSLGPTMFANASFTITSVADSSLLFHPAAGVLAVPDASALVFVSGVGTATFLIPTRTVVNQNLRSGGVSAPDQNLAILFANNPAFATYDLTTPIGPIAGTATFNLGLPFMTTAGDFSLTDVATLTFQAALQPVPEPSTLLLISIITVGIGGMIRIPAVLQRQRRGSGG